MSLHRRPSPNYTSSELATLCQCRSWSRPHWAGHSRAHECNRLKSLHLLTLRCRQRCRLALQHWSNTQLTLQTSSKRVFRFQIVLALYVLCFLPDTINAALTCNQTTWGITDRYSWIPGTFIGQGFGLLWDGQCIRYSTHMWWLTTCIVTDNYNEKTALTSVLNAL